ncbi:MAG: queuosine precursor transporter [Bacteroidales bacterium]|nr:queuosine precursor transporter [Bacteroidales bacterium]
MCIIAQIRQQKSDYFCRDMFNTKREILFTILAGFFVTNAVVGELIGGKLIQLGPFTMSIGIIPWPVVFLTTDIINEYYGKNGVRRLTLMTAGLIVYTFVLLLAGMSITASGISPVSDEQFRGVFGQSMWIIAGSVIAFLASQLTDVVIFWLIRNRTGKKMIWLRATGSTAGKLSFTDYINTAITGYSAKLIIAIAVTPLIYLGHSLVHSYLGKEQSAQIAEETAKVQ